MSINLSTDWCSWLTWHYQSIDSSSSTSLLGDALCVHSAEAMSGNQEDVMRIARQLLNRSIASRTISKQECMVELLGLPLVLCTESFETVNLSGSYKLQSDTHRDLLSQYRRLAPDNPTVSLHDFVTEKLKERNSGLEIIPHYVGASGQPKYPPTKEYAMATLLVYKPWAGKTLSRRSDKQWIEDFIEFVNSDDCPRGVALEFARVKDRYESKRPEEAVATEECYDSEPRAEMDDETKDILSIVRTQCRPTDPFFSINDYQFDRGLTYDWSVRKMVSDYHFRQNLAVVVPIAYAN